MGVYLMWFVYVVTWFNCFWTFTILYLLGNYTFWLPLRSAKLPRLVMLHQATPHAEASGMNMPPAKFEQLLQYWVKKQAVFCFVSKRDQYEGQSNVFALSFDDGFQDNYQYAFPFLKKYNAKATIYLATQIEGIEKLNTTTNPRNVSFGLN